MIVNYKGKQGRLPDFLIVGAARSGTTSLFHYLRQHPHVFMSAQHKEPRFFLYAENPPQNIKESFYKRNKKILWRFEDYVKLFETAKDFQVIGEASVSYLYYFSNTIQHIKSVYGERYKELKIIVILRNPVERAFSHYHFLVRKGRQKLSLKEAINMYTTDNSIQKVWGNDYIGFGMYYKMIKAYLEEFPNMKICFFEDLKIPNKLMRNLFEFLGVAPEFQIKTDVKVSVSGIPKNSTLSNMIFIVNNYFKHVTPERFRLQLIALRDNVLRSILDKPEIDNVLRKKMADILSPDIKKLQTLLNKDLSHWLNAKR
jgi:hypothetical protein